MESKYIAYHFSVAPKEPGTEILLAELGELAFDSFVETEEGLSAYIQEHEHTDDILNDIYILQNDEFTISYKIEEIEQINWNEEWEKNFDPIDVDGICYVRAPFHESKNAEYEIVIEPKMSFGTGHHETTFMMMKHILNMDVTNKEVLDMGCGTAILAILALMKGAKHADAIDIDNWCYLNSIENAERNNIINISVFEGDAALLNNKIDTYDLVIANINRNILLNDMEAYAKTLKQNGTILFSGFYTEDIAAIEQEANKNQLFLVDTLTRNNWASLKFIKK
ncbi:50S ribosomal protein L11 methyltransferase [Flavobacterium sp. xlx-214]|uniref:50S ribosomal protein L11 methyltransferase n=1 Tax=unclassified Flavobacterium TaxID=196869 RepID=UPI0013D312FE|nr:MULTISPECIES: 50S ribosomal protein L11 methyltransferase [unclassified Flavobacterium]MBA5793111.1 50S ribosomal protein L11 methyltransferase [Flavobacterium sp. xlx-221]QMI82602.1 50S ribosomal protein L11 methyltransferase [Flavobacterium sp. xlx-214]